GGLGIAAKLPESSLDVSGDVAHGALNLNGTPVAVRRFATPQGEPAKKLQASVMLGSLEVPVDAKGRFAASVPHADGDAFDVSMVDAKGRAALAHVQLPLLEITAPQGDLVLPFGEAADGTRLAPDAAIVGEAGAQLAAMGGAAGGEPAAWTQGKGRTDAGKGVEVNGLADTVAEDGAFAAEVPLHVGENTINVLARDASGLTNRAAVTVAVADRDANGEPVVAEESTPELTLFLPPKGVPLQSNALNLAGRTKPGYQLIVNRDSGRIHSAASSRHRQRRHQGHD